MIHSRRVVACVFLVTLLAACAGLPPRTPEPMLRDAAPLSVQSAESTAGTWPDARWWLRYRDDTLTALIETALAQAPSMSEAAARFDGVQQQLRLAGAARGVHFDASASSQRQRLSDYGMIPPAFLGFNWYDQIDVGVRARYSIDWWGRQRAEIAAAVSQARAAEAERAAAALTLATAVADSYFGWQADQERLGFGRRQVEIAQHQLRVNRERFAAGLERDDVPRRSAAQLAAAEEQLAALEGSAELRRVVLAALLGCAPAELPPLMARALPDTPVELPSDIGIDLVARRADIAASRWRVEAAFQTVKAARAEFLPDISLNALAALSSIDYAHLLDLGSRTPALGAAIHLPLFDAGALEARHAGRRAELRAAVAGYDAVLVAAAREVGEQVALRTQIARRLRARREQSGAIEQLAAAARRRVQQGLTDIRAELAAEAAVLEQHAAETDLEAAAVAADIALIQALGGGYESSGNPS